MNTGFIITFFAIFVKLFLLKNRKKKKKILKQCIYNPPKGGLTGKVKRGVLELSLFLGFWSEKVLKN